MNFAQQQADPRRRIVGFGAVLLFHVLIVYALVTGLAKKVVDVVRAPIETKVIEEIKKPPPPPEVVVPPPPKLEAPPPPFIPPPEMQIATPPPPQPTITPTTPTPPPAPVVITPAPPPVAAAPPAPPAPAPPTTSAASVVCSNYATVMGDVAYPREAQRAGHRARRSDDPVHAGRRPARSRTSRRSARRTRSSRATACASSASTSARARAATSSSPCPSPTSSSGAPLRPHPGHRLPPIFAILRRKNVHAALPTDLGASRDAARLAGLLCIRAAVLDCAGAARVGTAAAAPTAAAPAADAGCSAGAARADDRSPDLEGDGRQPVRPRRALGRRATSSRRAR